MEEIIKAVNAHFGAGIITDVYFVQRDQNGVIRTITPCVQSESTRDLTAKLLSASEGLKIMATDLINKSLAQGGRNN